MSTLSAVAADGLFRAGVVGVGQTAQPTDSALASALCTQMVSQWQNERVVTVTPGELMQFPDQTTDVPFWTQFQDTLTWNLALRIRAAYQLPLDQTMVAAAERGLAVLQANNKQAQTALLDGPVNTIKRLIYLSLRLADRITDTQGVADGSQDLVDGLALLQMMIADWQTRRWLVPCLQEVVYASTGFARYAVTNRFDRVESAYARYSAGGQPIDYSLEILQSQEDYNRICLKSLQTWPSTLWYDQGFPQASVYLWPVPGAGQYQIHIWTKRALQTMVNLTDPLIIPPVYQQALAYNLALRFPRDRGVQLRPDVVAMARSSLDSVRGSNLQVPLLRMPRALGQGRSRDWLFGGAGGGGGQAPTTPPSGQFSDTDFSTEFDTA